MPNPSVAEKTAFKKLNDKRISFNTARGDLLDQLFRFVAQGDRLRCTDTTKRIQRRPFVTERQIIRVASQRPRSPPVNLTSTISAST